mmetsp:Transcript_18238/g.51079  ORF Transcript_18238/g.51079 Transcript_18238/m.51079 type:complete len:442 (-) Transcript_18238:221-1546(-)
MAAQEDTQLLCCFVTKLGEEFRVPEEPVSIPANIGRYGLSQIVNAMLSLDPPRPFDFMVSEELVRAPLHEVLLKGGISAESTLTIEYMPAVLPPTSKQQCPHDDWVTAVVGAEACHATSGSSDGLIRSWAMGLEEEESGTSAVSCTSSFFAHAGGVTALARAKAGKSSVLLFSAGKDGMVRLWQNESKGWTELLATFEGHTESVEGVAVSPDGERLATCGWDKAIKLWRAGEVVLEAAREAAAAQSTKKASKKRRTAAGEEATVADGRVVEESWGSLEGHTQCVTAVAWADAHHLLSGSWDHSIKRWDANTASTVDTLNAPKAIHCVAAASDHVTVFGSSDRVLRVWDSRGRGEALNFRGFASHSGWIKSVAMCPGSPHHFVSGSYDSTVKLWDLRSAIPLATLKSHTDKVMCTGWLGQEIILSGGADCSLRSHSTSLPAV